MNSQSSNEPAEEHSRRATVTEDVAVSGRGFLRLCSYRAN